MDFYMRSRDLLVGPFTFHTPWSLSPKTVLSSFQSLTCDTTSRFLSGRDKPHPSGLVVSLTVPFTVRGLVVHHTNFPIFLKNIISMNYVPPSYYFLKSYCF